MTTYTVAAVNSPQAKKDIASHVCDGIDDHVQINLAIGDSESGDTVLLYEGTYNLRGNISPKGSTTFKGEGPTKTFLELVNCGLFFDGQYSTVEDIHVEGSGYGYRVWWNGLVNIRSSHCTVRRVHATADSSPGCVFHTVSDIGATTTSILQDIEWDDCEVKDTGTYGFLHNYWDEYRERVSLQTHQNIRYINCRAIRCGNADGTGAKGQFNPWVTGFDFAETNNIDNLIVTGCLAEGNWESGFHMEWDPIKTNCAFTECISKYNGAKPTYPNEPVMPEPGAEPGSGEFFGSGWYLPNFQGTLTQCYAEGNSRCGFWVTNGGVLTDCTDVDTGISRGPFTYVRPTSFFGYPCRTQFAGKALHLIRCKSLNSRGFGFWYDIAEAIYMEDCEMINAAGIDGYCARFGSNLSSHFRNSSIKFKRIEAGSGVTAINAHQNQSVEYGPGLVVSDALKPVAVTGSQTSNVTFADWTTVSQTLPVGPGGVTIEGGAAVGEVTLDNVVVVSTDPVEPGEPGAWLEEYPYRVSVGINPDYVDADLVDIPVPIAVDNSVFTHLFGEIGADWAKMMITDNAGTALKAEVTLWDPTLMKGLLYVRVPVISATEPTPIHIYYGADVPVNPLLGFTTDASAEAIWEDLNYEGVWHSRQGETPGNMVDSSSKHRDIATQGSPTFGTLGPRNFVDFPIGGHGMAPVGYSTLNAATAITVEATVRLDNLSLDTWNEQMWFGQNSPAGHRFYLAAYGNPPRWAGAIGNQAWTVNDGPVCSEEITHIAWVVDKSTSVASLYVNGTLVETKTGWTWGDLDANPYLAWANAAAGAPAEPYRSDITFFDLKISTALRSAAWIKVLAMAELGTLYTYHEYEEAPEPWTWIEGYPYRVSVGINPDYIDADLVDIPVPIAVDNSVFTHLFGEIGAEWAKMMITDNAGTALKAEVTLWDPTLMKGLLYIRVPVISATEPTPIHIYYGADVPVNPLLGFTTDASAETVWEDLNYEGVWHSRQGETPGNMVDSSSKQHDIATQGSPTFGTLGPRNFVDFPVGRYRMVPVGYSTLNAATAITVEATVRLDNLSLDTWNEQMWFGQNSPAGHRFYLAAYGNPPRWAGAIGNQAWTVNDGPVCSEEITHIAWVVDKSTSVASLYVNGTLVETKTEWTWGDLNANPYLAWINAAAEAPAEPYRSDITFFDLKISTALRSAAWIKALAMAELGTLYTYHECEEAPAEPIPGS